ncbi:hypothetical protein HMPREF1576_01504 [Gardnerella pickettii JCP7719]|uniref:Uncharacterized protein n=1 Tax=Gardnerella pickettii JCP7719 TaxID=1261061 RepID=S4GRF2_9BIFI|nr:hypothetical protein HMPREF1576_01504 [Gardnerella pickettii JCP7719]
MLDTPFRATKSVNSLCGNITSALKARRQVVSFAQISCAIPRGY